MLHDLLGRPPARVKLLRAISPYNDLDHMLVAGRELTVASVEPDGLGIGVKTNTGKYVSLHPSEFSVISWAERPAARSSHGHRSSAVVDQASIQTQGAEA